MQSPCNYKYHILLVEGGSGESAYFYDMGWPQSRYSEFLDYQGNWIQQIDLSDAFPYSGSVITPYREGQGFLFLPIAFLVCKEIVSQHNLDWYIF